MPRFAILIHDHPFLHWDFLLEAGTSCRTWRLLQSPDFQGEVLAEAIADHRLVYLDYEGPVSGNRGQVIKWDSGTFEWRINEPDAVVVDVAGSRIRGPVRLRQRTGNSWIWASDKFQGPAMQQSAGAPVV